MANFASIRTEKKSVRALGTDAFFGLTDAEVKASRQSYGENVLVKKKRKSFFKKFLENFGDPMIKVLLLALGINVVFLFRSADWFDSVGIAIAIVIATLVSTISEYGSEAAFEKLSEEAARLVCRVRRAGVVGEIPVKELVVGDLVLLNAGDRVPADGVLVKGSVDVDQSVLNGESKEAHKKLSGKPIPVSAEVGRKEFESVGGGQKEKATGDVLGQANSTGVVGGKKTSGTDFVGGQNAGSVGAVDFSDPTRLFSGTVVTGGDAVMRVTSVGENTFYGKLAEEIQEDAPKSPLKIKLEALAKKISVFGYIGAVLVALSYLFYAFIISNDFDGARILASITDLPTLVKHLMHTATLAVSVIVMAVPEGLPMMVTVVMSANMKRMYRDNVLVKKLNGIETAGSMNILFTDKTGTITNGKLDVVSVVFGDGGVFDAESVAMCMDKQSEMLALGIIGNSSAEFSGGRAIGGNVTDRCLLEYAKRFPVFKSRITKTSVVPFSSDLKFMASRVSGTYNLDLVKGAPERLLSACTHYLDENGNKIEITEYGSLNDKIKSLSSNSIRMIAVAMSENPISADCKLCDLTLVGLVGLRDQIRPEAAEGVRLVKSAGIQTVMITGDAKDTAVAIANEAGLLADGVVLTSDELAAMSDAEVKKLLPRLCVVARALPGDKSRLVRLAQELNLVVGMTGDGINDAPALKKADIGFAMGSGTEIAKEAGDIVILDDNLLSIGDAVSYGRTIFKSIRKFLIFELTINFCAVFISIAAPLLGIGTPITVVQMLWINLVMDTLAGLAFAGERPRVKYMMEAPKKRDEPLINRYMWSEIGVAAVFTAVLSLWFLKSNILANLNSTYGAAYGATAYFTLFMFVAIFNSVNVRTSDLNLLSYIAANKQFIAVMSLVTLIQVGMIYLGGSLFGTTPLKPLHLLIIVAAALVIIPIDLIRKLIYKKTKLPMGT